jgi:hypothetical protein
MVKRRDFATLQETHFLGKVRHCHDGDGGVYSAFEQMGGGTGRVARPGDDKTRGGSTMKAAFKTLLGLAVVVAAVMVARAAEDKEEKAKKVTLKGDLGCGKCVFKLDKEVTGGKCCNAISVKKGDKATVYVILDKKGKETYHKDICTAKKKGSVTGVVSKKGDQHYIKPEKDGVKFDE